ncbi:hypothetical protein LEMLEM_LOCUS22443, partial [Lemmus lemmus]
NITKLFAKGGVQGLTVKRTLAPITLSSPRGILQSHFPGDTTSLTKSDCLTSLSVSLAPKFLQNAQTASVQAAIED